MPFLTLLSRSSEFWFLEHFTLEYCTILSTSKFVSYEIVKNDRFWTDLDSLIGHTKCENFRIFLCTSQILWEINFGHSAAPKTAILNIWAALILNFWELLTSSSVQFVQKSKFKAYKIVRLAVSDLLKSAKIDFT